MRYEILYWERVSCEPDRKCGTGLFFDDRTGIIYITKLKAFEYLSLMRLDIAGYLYIPGVYIAGTYFYKNRQKEKIYYDKIKKIEKEGEWEDEKYEIMEEGLCVILNDTDGKHLLFCCYEYINKNPKLKIDENFHPCFLQNNDIRKYTNPVTIIAKQSTAPVFNTIFFITNKINIKELIIMGHLENEGGALVWSINKILKFVSDSGAQIVIKTGNFDKNGKIIEKQ